MKSDLIVVGGSFAGLSAATQLLRAGRKVMILDAGQPRNRFASAAHGFFGFDGDEPIKILERAQSQTLSYPTVSRKVGRVEQIDNTEEGFTARCEDGSIFQARRLLISTGVADTFPDVSGMRERWGGSVLHCPYCHGFEYMGAKIGVFAQDPMALHQAVLLADWGPVTLFTNGVLEIEEEQKVRLDARNVTVETSPIVELSGLGQSLEVVTLSDGNQVEINVLYIATQVSLRNRWIEDLGCVIDQGPLGPMIRTDDRQATNVAGVYAAGDCARQPHNATFACADGVTAAMGIHMSLIEEELEQKLVK